MKTTWTVNDGERPGPMASTQPRVFSDDEPKLEKPIQCTHSAECACPSLTHEPIVDVPRKQGKPPKRKRTTKADGPTRATREIKFPASASTEKRKVDDLTCSPESGSYRHASAPPRAPKRRKVGDSTAPPGPVSSGPTLAEKQAADQAALSAFYAAAASSSAKLNFNDFKPPTELSIDEAGLVKAMSTIAANVDYSNMERNREDIWDPSVAFEYEDLGPWSVSIATTGGLVPPLQELDLDIGIEVASEGLGPEAEGYFWM